MVVIGRFTIFTNNSNNIRFYGLDTNEPILQICGNNTFFCGHFEHIFGTNVLFEIKDKIYFKTEDNQNNNKLIEYLGKSHKKLVMKRVFVEQKTINESNDNSINETIDSNDSNNTNTVSNQSNNSFIPKIQVLFIEKIFFNDFDFNFCLQIMQKVLYNNWFNFIF